MAIGDHSCLAFYIIDHSDGYYRFLFPNNQVEEEIKATKIPDICQPLLLPLNLHFDMTTNQWPLKASLTNRNSRLIVQTSDSFQITRLNGSCLVMLAEGLKKPTYGNSIAIKAVKEQNETVSHTMG